MQLFSKTLPNKNKSIATWLTFALIPISGLVTDVYIPSMPHMATDLQQTDSSIQLTLTLFLISYGITQIIAGSILDSFGRYNLGILSLCIFIVASIAVTQTDSIIVIHAMRIVQGITTGFIVVGKRAFFIDVYEGARLKSYLSVVSIVWSIAPIVAPFIGGYLENHFNWRANFYLLSIYGTVMLMLELLFSGETLKQRHSFQLKSVMQNYGVMLRFKPFSLGLIMMGLSYGMVMIFGLSGSFIIEHKMNFSPLVAGYVALILGLAWMCGGIIGKTLVQKPLVPKLRLANYLQLLFIVLMIITANFMSNIYTLTFFAFIIHVTAGFTFNTYFTFNLTRFPAMAGIASGLLGGVTFVITSVLSYVVVGIAHPVSQQMVGICYTVMALMGFVILNIFISSKKYHLITAPDTKQVHFQEQIVKKRY